MGKKRRLLNILLVITLLITSIAPLLVVETVKAAGTCFIYRKDNSSDEYGWYDVDSDSKVDNIQDVLSEDVTLHIYDNYMRVGKK